MQNILVVDDDPTVRNFLERYLMKQGYGVSTAVDGREMRARMAEGKVDLVIMDLMLPDEDGLSLTRTLRATSNVPIIMVTAREDTVDRVIGLEVGADDYLPKPFDSRELLARIRSVMRRSAQAAPAPAPAAPPDAPEVARFAGWTLNMSLRRLSSATQEPVSLTAAEFDLLRAFVEHPRKPLTRNQLLDFARGRETFLTDRTVDVHVMRLRRKLEADPRTPQLIITVHGTGYMFAPTVEWGT